MNLSDRKRQLTDRRQGFTLIEIMVAVSIFVIVAFIVSTTLLVVIDASRRANVMRAVMDNINFAVDSMSFKLKFGHNYQIVPGTGGESDKISFIDRDGKNLTYCHGKLGTDKQTIYFCQREVTNDRTACGESVPGGDDVSDCHPITSADINVIEMRIKKVTSCGAGDCPAFPNQQIIIAIKAEANIKQTKTSVDFQTSVTQAQSQATP